MTNYNQKYLLYKEPLKVVCVKTGGSVKLIKGATYLANSLFSNSRSDIKTVQLKNLGSYHATHFKYNDKSLNDEPDFIIEHYRFDRDKDYTDKFVICNWSNGISLKEGEIYYVESHIKTSSGYKRYSTHEFKIRGIKNPVSAYQFSEVPLIDQRNLKMKSLYGEDVVSNVKTRKFLLYTEKEKTLILFEALTKILKDLKNVESKNKISISNLILTKTRKYNTKIEDLDDFLIKAKPLLNAYSDILF
jgi:hypothetical protein